MHKSRVELDRQKPLKFVELFKMDQEERDETFRDLMKQTHQAMLNDARKGGELPVKLVLIVLTFPSGERRLIMHDAEYGDNETVRRCHDTVKDLRRLLKPGERLSVKIVEIAPLTFLKTP